MQLREISIDGFGIFANQRIVGLQSGLNVLYGQNEFGKTTILEFIRRVLFGFRTRRSSANQYRRDGLSRYGGQLLCEMSDGDLLTIKRVGGKSVGDVSISQDDGKAILESDFRARLGGVSEDFYRNVYAVSLEELQEDSKTQLQSEELRNRIYGAGLGLGQVSITQLKKEFSDTAERIYKPGGSREMHKTVRELMQLERETRSRAAELAQYGARKSERDDLAVKVSRLQERQRALQTELSSLENQRNLFDAFVQRRDALSRLSQLGEVTDVPDITIEQLKATMDEIESTETVLKGLEKDRTELQADLARMSYDPAVLQQDADIKSLLSGLTQLNEAQQHLPRFEADQRVARDELSHNIGQLGLGWTDEAISSFVLTATAKDSLRTQAENLDSRHKAVEKARSRLEDYRIQTRAARARPGLPLLYRIIGVAILGLSLAACVHSATSGISSLTIILGGLAVLGLVVALSPGSSSGPLRDRTTEELGADMSEATQALEEALAAWRGLLRSLQLPSELSPEAVAELERLLNQLQLDRKDIDTRQERIDTMHAVIDTAQSRLNRIVASLAQPFPVNDVASAIQALDSLLDETQDLRASHEQTLHRVHALDRKIRSNQDSLSESRQRLTDLMSPFGASTQEELIKLHEDAAKKRTLAEEFHSASLSIQKVVGIDSVYEEFLARMEHSTPQRVLERLNEVKSDLQDVAQEMEEANRSIGGLDSELQALASADTLLELESSAETLRQRLRDSYRSWLTAQLALWAIGHAISKYETTRQPAVIRQAQTAFKLITDDRYPTLVSPLDSNELHVRDNAGQDVTVDELSRGTREQLYLSMRLGFIEQYEQNAEPLPVVMDDILVNFDDGRASLAVSALARFARKRQVIVMTCHERTRDLYRSAGARELAVESTQKF